MKNYKVLPKSAENIEGNTSINSSVFIEQNNFPEQDSEFGWKAEQSISVVIPNYNGKHLLEANLPTVMEALKYINIKKKPLSPFKNNTDFSFEIIVVDDASNDKSVEFIQQNYPEIILLINEHNKGFSTTINKGIFIAKHELILVLNSDVQLTENYFIEQLKYFKRKDTFGVMSKIIDPPNRGKSNTAIHKVQDGAKYPKTSFRGVKTTYNYLPTNESLENWLPSFFLSGANALMNKEKLIQLGGFDEIYSPYYYEDADLGIRAWSVGWKCYFEPKSICMHTPSSTISKLKSEKVKLIIERNRIIFNNIHLRGWQLHFFNCWLWLRCIIKLIKGNSTIYKAILLFRENKYRIKKSKEKLLQLCEKTKKYYSVYDTEKYILKKIKKIKYRIF